MSDKHVSAAVRAPLDMLPKMVLIAIASHADPKTGAAYPSQPAIAERAGCSIRAVRNAITQLVDAGYLAVHGRANHVSIYVVQAPSTWPKPGTSKRHVVPVKAARGAGLKPARGADTPARGAASNDPSNRHVVPPEVVSNNTPLVPAEPSQASREGETPPVFGRGSRRPHPRSAGPVRPGIASRFPAMPDASNVIPLGRFTAPADATALGGTTPNETAAPGACDAERGLTPNLSGGRGL